MKATKKIVGAAVALVASVALSAGSTFAWFASESTVKVTGMSVSLHAADQTVLTISNTKAGLFETNDTEQKKIVNTNASATALYSGDSATFNPVAFLPYDSTATTATGIKEVKSDSSTTVSSLSYSTYFAGSYTTYTDGAGTTAASPWYTARSKSSSDGAEDVTNTTRRYLAANELTSSTNGTTTTYSNYVLKNEVYIGVVNNAANASNLTMDVSVTKSSAAANLAYIGVLVVFSNGSANVGGTAKTVNGYIKYQYIDGTTTKDYTGVGNYSSITTATDNTNNSKTYPLVLSSLQPNEYIKAEIYIYYDGTNSAVYGTQTLDGVSVSITFAANESTTSESTGS